MSDASLRLIRDGPMPGAVNMSRDEALATAEPSMKPALRLYSFEPVCVTIGRFQEYPGGLDAAECRRIGVDVVRRPTGGLAILHASDLTYCFVMPVTGDGRERARDDCFETVASCISRSLRLLGLDGARVSKHRENASGTWCFATGFGVDIEWNSLKICGSAQKVVAGAVLQHGTVLLKRRTQLLQRVSRTPVETAGGTMAALETALGREVTWNEAADAFEAGFAETLGVSMLGSGLSGAEITRAKELERRYSSGEWLERADD